VTQTKRSAETRQVPPGVDSSFAQQLLGYSLTTAEILYRLPDHPALLQSYVWQDYDQHPRFPKLQAFLAFWSSNLDGALHCVRVAHHGLISAREFRYVDGMLIVH
jgi:uncharacterized protein Usg